MATEENDQHEAGSRKPSRRHRPMNRLQTSEFPVRLQQGDDTNEDVTAPARVGATAPQHLNQSIFSMITAAGSKTDFTRRFDESSESEVEDTTQDQGDTSPQNRISRSIFSTVRPQASTSSDKQNSASFLPHRGLHTEATVRPLHGIVLQTREDSQLPSGFETDFPSVGGHQNEISRSNSGDVHPTSSILTSVAKHTPISNDVPDPQSLPQGQFEQSVPANLLAARLKEVFGFDAAEEVVAEYPCWLMQSILLQGYLYMTRRHLCFFAYLPKKSSIPTKSGYLAKKGKTTLKYSRYWFNLRGDVLTYFLHPSNVYFPRGNIDLRYGVSASLSTAHPSQRDCKDFSVTTSHRTYHFRAETPGSANEWVRSLQKTIFNFHNDGDSVKISLPIDDIIDIEESPVVDFAETIKVRVVESGDSYAIDEYFFTFFSHGIDALNMLGTVISHKSDLSHQRLSAAAVPTLASSQDVAVQPEITAKKGLSSNWSKTFAEASVQVPAEDASIGQHTGHQELGNTPLDTPGNRISPEGRMSTNTQQRHIQQDEHGLGSPPRNDEATESYAQSSGDNLTDSSVAAASQDAEARMSASQILDRSDFFRKPPVRRMETVLSVSTSEHDPTMLDDATMSGSNRIEGERQSSTHQTTEQAPALHTTSDQKDLQSPVPGIDQVRNASFLDIIKTVPTIQTRAGRMAGYVKHTSSRMSKYLATESMSYLEKVQGMWQGGHKHYGENEGIVSDEQGVDPEDEEANVGHGDRFRAHFALSSSEKLRATYFGYLHRVLPLYGKIYVSNRKFCFRSLLPGTRTKLILPLRDIENVDKEKGFRFGYHGLVIVIRGFEELFFEFKAADTRNDCTITLLHSLEGIRYMDSSGTLSKEDQDGEAAAKSEHRLLLEAHQNKPQNAIAATATEMEEALLQRSATSHDLFDDQRSSLVNFKPSTALRITCLTIGSRGDVQPYIALCKGLLNEGHYPRIATHAEFGPWIESYGIAFTPVGGDPAELMRICIENGMFTYSFLREATAKFRGWIDDLLTSSWAACQNCDLLIESPSAMAGIHIAEALGIPYFRAFTMPWTRTRAYPHAFAVPEHKVGGAYNYFSYVMFDNVFWKGIAGQVNRWRKKELGLHPTNLDKMQPNKIPFLYNFSSQVVGPPLDYPDWVRVTGYWFLDEGLAGTYTPPEDLATFIAQARTDGKKLVYIGFGSIVVSDPQALTRTVIESVQKADVRCILSKGWSDRLSTPVKVPVIPPDSGGEAFIPAVVPHENELPLPPEIHQIKSAPHDWLFRQVDAAIHHGGAGTTGASLRAGIPTVIKPFFGDQFFFGNRVEDLGVGILLRKINVSVLARALWEATHSERLRERARRLGEAIRKEDGVKCAIQAIYRDLEYAQTITKAKRIASLVPPAATNTDSKDATFAEATIDYEGNVGVGDEESWTFVDSDRETETEAHQTILGSLAPDVRFQPEAL